MFKRPIFLVTFTVFVGALVLIAGILLSQRNENISLDSSRANSEQVVEMLSQLIVQPEKPTKVGKVLADDNWKVHHYCTTRTSVLDSESDFKQHFIKGKKCKTGVGHWVSPYDGKPTNRALDLDIDHMVPKAEAWQSGAWDWTDERLKAYKNDLGYRPSLIAVTKSENEGGKKAKGDKEPGFDNGYYLPPLASYRCTYVAEWIAVKWRWRLSVDIKEKANLHKIMSSCGGKIKIPMPIKAQIN